MTLYDQEGFAPLRAAWIARAYKEGPLCIKGFKDSSTLGTFDSLDAEGRLTLRDAQGMLHTFTTGDVALVTPTE